MSDPLLLLDGLRVVAAPHVVAAHEASSPPSPTAANGRLAPHEEGLPRSVQDSQRPAPVLLCEGLSLRVAGPRALLVGDAEPILGPLFRRAVVEAGTFVLRGQPLDEIAPTSLGLVPLDPPLPLRFSPLDAVVWSARLAGVAPPGAATLAARLCELVGLGAWSAKPLGSLHVAYRRLTTLACALVTGPAVLILEAPLAGLDAQAADYVAQAILLATAGRSALISSTPPIPDSADERLAERLDERVLLGSPTAPQPLAAPRPSGSAASPEVVLAAGAALAAEPPKAALAAETPEVTEPTEPPGP